MDELSFNENISAWKLYKKVEGSFVEVKGFNDYLSDISNWEHEMNNADYVDDGYIDHFYKFTCLPEMINN